MCKVFRERGQEMSKLLDYIEPEINALKYGSWQGRKNELSKEDERLLRRMLIGATVFLCVIGALA